MVWALRDSCCCSWLAFFRKHLTLSVVEGSQRVCPWRHWHVKCCYEWDCLSLPPPPNLQCLSLEQCVLIQCWLAQYTIKLLWNYFFRSFPNYYHGNYCLYSGDFRRSCSLSPEVSPSTFFGVKEHGLVRSLQQSPGENSVTASCELFSPHHLALCEMEEGFRSERCFCSIHRHHAFSA